MTLVTARPKDQSLNERFSDNSKLNELSLAFPLCITLLHRSRGTHTQNLDQSAGHICTSALSLALSALAFPAVAFDVPKTSESNCLAVVVPQHLMADPENTFSCEKMLQISAL